MMEKLDRITSLMAEMGILEEQMNKVFELRERLSGNELIVSVVGQFKRGKSSLINAMLGDEVLPVGIVPLTAVVTEIRCGEHFRAIVEFENGTEKEIETGELPDYISEQKNKNNDKRVSAVKLWTENTPFGRNTTLVDTPGVGSVHQHNTEASRTYIERSDAVLFLLSVDSPVSEVERDFLLYTREYTSKFYFAVNKVDTVSVQSRDEFIEYCASVLSELAGFPVKLYPVSAVTGQGMQTLIQEITGDINVSRTELLSESIAFKLNGIIHHAKSKISLYLNAAAIPADELKEKLSALREKQLALSALSDEVEILTKRQTDKLVDHIGEQMEGFVTALLPEMEAEANDHYEKLKNLPSRSFEQKLLLALEKGLHSRLTALNEKGLRLLSEGYDSIIKALNSKVEETARFVSDMVKDFFGVEYAVEIKAFTVSQRNDFYVRFQHNESLFIDKSNFVHLLPRSKANAKIFGCAIVRMREDIQLNKTNMLYNYRYKMQESLRVLCRQFSADVLAMSAELNTLFAHVEKSHQSEDEGFRQTKEKLEIMLGKLESETQ